MRVILTDGLGTDNEARADLGDTAVESVAGAMPWHSMPAVVGIEDTLTYIAHLCDRVGLPPAETFRGALRRYRTHLENGPRVASAADGTRTTLEELQLCHEG